MSDDTECGKYTMIRVKFLPLILSVFLLANGAAHAGFRVAPIKVQMNPGERSSTLKITNLSPYKNSIQIQAKEWHQEGGQHLGLNDTKQVLIYPPITTLNPGEEQTVRVIVRGAKPGSYRIVMKEVRRPNVQGVQTLFNVMVPMFLEGRDWKPELSMTAELRDGSYVLRAENSGLAHARVSEVSGFSQNTYILPGYSQEIAVPARAIQGTVLTVVTDEGSHDVQIAH